ncbi:cation:proton antiporter [Halobacteriaceae bacterium SHR40]|uniref:cation:proton antiporter domain-containing protein n=1 Tax=Halovenus amylolytica TaxID=2500550 RepID=UPI000FE2AD85
MSTAPLQAIELLPSAPFEQPVVVLALALASFLVAPILIERVGLPGIVGIVLAGTALGPNGLGILARSEAIVLLGNAGLVYLLFTVGLELDLRRFFAAPEDAALFGTISFGLPFVVGTGVCMLVLGFDVWAAMLLAAVFATHTLLAYPVVNKLDLTKNSAVTAVFGGILFTDTAGLIVLALALGVIQDGLSLRLIADIGVSLLVLFGGLWLVIPPVARWFFRNASQESYFEFLFVATLVFAAASLAEGLGLAAILGAFVAGIALNREIARGGTLMNRIEFFGNAFFIPFFLFHVGMLVDPAVIVSGPETLWISAVILGVMFSTKIVAAGAVGRIQGYSRNQVGVLVGLSIGQAAAALAITLLGFEAGVFSADVLNAVVVMILVTAIASPWLTERYGVGLATEREATSTVGEPYDPRILLPLSRTADRQQHLLELAFVLKDSPASTPVHLLTVLEPDATDEELTDTERTLQSAAETGGGAEVPVEVATRVNHNVASAIAAATVETRADLILLGWDPGRSLGGRVFGNTIDQVRQRTTDPVLVSRLGRPVNTTTRLLLVLPPAVGHHEGFSEGIYLVKRMAEKLGVPIEAVAVGTRISPAKYEELIGTVDPEMAVTVTHVDGWDGLGERLDAAAAADLVVPLKPREGGLGWAPELRRLPRQIVDAPPEAFVIVTPRQGDPGYAARFLRLD